MRIPEVRKALLDISEELREKKENSLALLIELLVEELKRRPPVRKTARKRTRMTSELADKIRETAKKNPELSEDELGLMFNVDGGRVSESLAGKRK